MKESETSKNRQELSEYYTSAISPNNNFFDMQRGLVYSHNPGCDQRESAMLNREIADISSMQQELYLLQQHNHKQYNDLCQSSITRFNEVDEHVKEEATTNICQTSHRPVVGGLKSIWPLPPGKQIIKPLMAPPKLINFGNFSKTPGQTP